MFAILASLLLSLDPAAAQTRLCRHIFSAAVLWPAATFAQPSILDVSPENSLLTPIVMNGENAPAMILKSTVQIKIFRPGQLEPNICTGAIYGRKSILTAAHCVRDAREENVQVEFFDKPDRRVAMRKVDHIVVHSNYDPGQSFGGVRYITRKGPSDPKLTSNYDLALLHIQDELPKGFKVVRKLPARDFALIQENQQVYATGFGLSAIDRKDAGILRWTPMRISSLKSRYEMVVRGENAGICVGDSGGPLYVFRGYKFYIIAIARASKCRNTAWYTNIEGYTEWITANDQFIDFENTIRD